MLMIPGARSWNGLVSNLPWKHTNTGGKKVQCAFSQLAIGEEAKVHDCRDLQPSQLISSDIGGE